MKIPVIELIDFNVTLSFFDFLTTNFDSKQVNGKTIDILSSYSDIKIPYKVPSISFELMYRKNRSIGFNNYYGEQEIEDNEGTYIIELEGTLYEYRIQLNVYSNTRGENSQWSSMLDDILKNGESGIAINTYNQRGDILQSNVGYLSYDFSKDVKSNYMNPNIETYDYHNIFEVKAYLLQKYKMQYDIMELGDIIGKLK